MDTQKFIDKIKRLHPLQAVTIKFNKHSDSIVSLVRLRTLVDDTRGMNFDSGDIIVTMVITHGDWNHSRNGNITIVGLSLADEDMLAEIARDVESIEHPEHSAQGIDAKREKTRLVALGELRDAVLPACEQEAEMWGLTLGFETVEDDTGFMIAFFMVMHGDKVEARIGIDGWSGRLVIENRLSGYRYTNAGQVQQLLGELISDVANELTAA